MKSISKFVDGATLAAEVRMERQSHKGAFLLVEGATDARRLMQVVDEALCSFVVCFGKKNVIEAIESLYEDGHPGIVGAVDADFSRLDGSVSQHEGIIVSSLHDFDLEMVLTDVLRRYLGETCDDAKLQAWGGHSGIAPRLMLALRPLSILRFVNQKYRLRYSLTNVRHDEFFDGQDIDQDAMINSVSNGRLASNESNERLRSLMLAHQAVPGDLEQITSGHDFCAALGIALRHRLGSRREAQTWRSEVEMHLRLAFSIDDMATTKTYGAMKCWEEANPGYALFKEQRRV